MRISLLFENEAYNIFEQHRLLCSSKFLSLSYDLTLPIVGSTFQLTGRHDVIRSSRSEEILAASQGSSTSGSNAYFLFTLHDPKSAESGHQQLTTRLSLCILDMCAGLRLVHCNFSSSIAKQFHLPIQFVAAKQIHLPIQLVIANLGCFPSQVMCNMSFFTIHSFCYRSKF